MPRFRPLILAALAVLTLFVLGEPARAQAPAGGTGRIPPPVFADADRRARLERAFPEIDRLFAQFAERTHVPGIAYGVLIDGELAHVGTIGVRERETKSPVGADTVFRIASMTKSFTALAILRLRDEGRLSLEDPAEKYVPELAGLAYPTADSPRITIRHLLSHAEGFPEDNPWGDQQLAVTDAEMTAMIRAGIPFSTSPGTAYEYSNFGFAILGRIVSRVSGQPYASYVSTNILKPLGMTATTLEAGSVPAARLAHGYRWEDETWKPEPLLPDGAFGSMGGMLTSTQDLARYVGFLMSAWPARDDPDTGPVRRSSLREMQQVWRPSPATVTRDRVDMPVRLNTGGYAFGLRVWQNCAIGHIVAHSGGLPGFGSHMRWLPEHGVAIIAMGNLTYTSWTRVVDDAIEALDRTGALKPRTPRPAAALVDAQASVSRLIRQWDDGLADRIAAVNLFLDEAKERRHAQVEALHATHGACRPDADFEVENALRGQWRMSCDRGWIRVAITLAPTMPPTIQYLSVRSVIPPDEHLSAVVNRLVSAVSAARAAGLPDVLAPEFDTAALSAQLGAMDNWGACRLGEVLDSDGRTTARVRLSCARGSVDMAVQLSGDRRLISRISLMPSPNQACGQ